MPLALRLSDWLGHKPFPLLAGTAELHALGVLTANASGHLSAGVAAHEGVVLYWPAIGCQGARISGVPVLVRFKGRSRAVSDMPRYLLSPEGFPTREVFLPLAPNALHCADSEFMCCGGDTRKVKFCGLT